MKVISLFDGLSAAKIAISNLNIPITKYYASEIDRYAITVSYNNHNDIIQLGDVNEIDGKLFKNIDLLIGGSPCQDLSSLKIDRKGLQGDKSILFFQYARLLREIKPKYFLLENVKMSGKSIKDRDRISEILGVEPLLINSDRFVQQNRERLYWTNIPVKMDELPERPDWDGSYWQFRRTYWRENKSGVCPTLTANMGTGGNNVPYIKVGEDLIKLTPEQCEKLQGIPECYTDHVSKTQRYKMIGNSFTVPVIEFILSYIKL